MVALLQPQIFDVDVHPIPARKSEPEHFHFDVRFLMRVVGAEDFVVSDESLDLAWVPLKEMASFTTEHTILRMAEKCLTNDVTSV